MADDLNRGTGRTTARMLHAIASAMENPDSWVAFQDHFETPACRQQLFVECIQQTCRQLCLTIDVAKRGGAIVLRSPISRLRAELEGR